ncbi:MAG: penicillin-binding transpeptidase domain-containing protein [Ardenticatenaceae bacterium]|nr:penicillin-binding transpeptidase domain-containing protein [Ardenticatenaceae bacterium]
MPRFIKLFLFLLAILGLAACTVSMPVLQDSFAEPTLTPFPTAEPATPTPVPGGAAEVGQTFYKAWERLDYLGMYSLLSEQSQALVTSDIFVNQYETAMRTATVQTVRAMPQGASQEGSRATLVVDVIWETAVVGTIERLHTVDLAFSNGRWGIVWDESLILPELAGGNRLLFDYQAPSRANIYDINGKALAFQGTAILLGVVPGQISDEATLLATLSPLLGLSPDEIAEKYATAQPDWYVPLGDIPAEVMQENYAALEPFLDEGGLLADDRLTRLYVNAAPHLVGYIGAIPPAQVNNYLALGYRPEAKVGLAGLEAWGESYLSGVKGGVLSVVNPEGQQIELIAETEPRQARSIFTTFDIEFQTAVENALANAIATHPAGRAGAVVVIDVETGAIRAMASYPTYNPAIFDPTRPNADQEIAALFADPRNPLLNRAANGAYPPGSTFKVVTLAAAVQSGLYTINSAYNSTGSWSRLGENFIKYDWRDGGHGYISYHTALVVSCNTCFYDAGLNMNEQDPFLFPQVARGFGLDTSTEILGLSDTPGIIPDPEWKPLNTAEGGWVPGDAVNMAIGQGYVTVTPLQMARIAAAIANGGDLVRPMLVDRIGSGGGAPEEVIPPEMVGQIPMDEATLAGVQSAMRDVTSSRSGTATFVFEDATVPVAGKTGTAQTPFPLPHAWFIGYAPAAPYTLPDGSVIDQPEIAVAVIVENAGEGSEVAAPIFRRIIELYYGITPLKPIPWSGS